MTKTTKTLPPIGAEKPVATPKTVTYYMGDSRYPYTILLADHASFRAYTIASLIVSGFVTLTKAGNAVKTKSGWSRPVAKSLLQSATRTWGQYLTPKGITVDGLNKITASLQGKEKGYSTTAERVTEMLGAIRDGKPVTVGQEKIALTVKRVVEIA